MSNTTDLCETMKAKRLTRQAERSNRETCNYKSSCSAQNTGEYNRNYFTKTVTWKINTFYMVIIGTNLKIRGLECVYFRFYFKITTTEIYEELNYYSIWYKKNFKYTHRQKENQIKPRIIGPSL